MINAHPHSNSPQTSGSGDSNQSGTSPSFSHTNELKHDMNSSFGGTRASDDMPGTHPSHSSEVPQSEPKSGFNSASPSHSSQDTVPSNSENSRKPSLFKSASFKKIAGLALLLMMVVGGGAAYYLQTQNQDVRQQAFLPDFGEDASGQTRSICDGSDTGSIQEDAGLEITVRESPICPRITDGNNTISSYSASYTLKNNSDYDLAVTYKSLNNYCPSQPYGDTSNGGEIPGCYQNTVEASSTVRLPKGNSESIQVIGQGASCGSWQTDLDITEIVVYQQGTSNIVKTLNTSTPGCLNNSDVEAWTLCQTGTQCSTTPTSTPTPTSAALSGTVLCQGSSNGQNYSYPVINATVNIAGGDYQESLIAVDETGKYTTQQIPADSTVAVRVELPDTITYLVNGERVRVPKSQVRVLAEKACNSAFLDANCGGMHPDVQSNCAVGGVNAYEWCTLKKSETNNQFNFVLTGCLSASEPTPTPAVGPQCVGLCGTTNASGCVPSATTNGLINGTRNPQLSIGDTIHFYCAYNPNPGTGYTLTIYKDGQTVKTINDRIGDYTITSVGSYSASCINTGSGS